MPRPVIFWGAAIGALSVIDYWCDRNAVEGDTLSEVTRAALRTDTRQGQALFTLGWAALTAWLVPHICRTIKEN